MTPKLVSQPAVTIDPCTGLVRVDNIIICKKVVRDGITFLQFKDGDRLRSQCRKANLVEIALADFAMVVDGIAVISES